MTPNCWPKPPTRASRAHDRSTTALASYEVRRNAATLPDYHENIEAARLGDFPPKSWRCVPPSATLLPISTRSPWPVAACRPRETFFNPENLARVMGRVAA